MTALEWLTWASVVVLIAGSLAVFVWFLRDARRLLERIAKSPEP